MNKEIIDLNQNNFLSDIENLITTARDTANVAVSSIIVATNWNIGKLIVEQEQNGKERADYGERLIQSLAVKLTGEFGASYNVRNLQYYRKFYLCFKDYEIVNTCVHNLSWSHFRRLITVSNEDARLWYMKEASDRKIL